MIENDRRGPDAYLIVRVRISIEGKYACSMQQCGPFQRKNTIAVTNETSFELAHQKLETLQPRQHGVHSIRIPLDAVGPVRHAVKADLNNTHTR